MKSNDLFRACGLVVRAAVVLLCAAGAGCLVVSDSHQTHSGNYVADETFTQIKPGQTTAAWVKATLGEPTKVSKVDEGTELWDYTYTEEKRSSGAVFLIFHGADEKESTGHAFVELKNGVVTRAWRG